MCWKARWSTKKAPTPALEVGPGEFVWRPAGSRHVAWSPKGGLFLAMFQIPNKFFEKDGRVVDAGPARTGTRPGATY